MHELEPIHNPHVHDKAHVPVGQVEPFTLLSPLPSLLALFNS